MEPAALGRVFATTVRAVFLLTTCSSEFQAKAFLPDRSPRNPAEGGRLHASVRVRLNLPLLVHLGIEKDLEQRRIELAIIDCELENV